MVNAKPMAMIKNKFLLLLLGLFFIFTTRILGIVAAPLDVIVGIYHPFRDHIWSGFVAGVPFKNASLSDVVSVILPWKELAVTQYLEKIIPLWNPYTASSMPLAANFQSGTFYPFNIIIILLSLSDIKSGFLLAWNLYIFLIPILTFLFTYLFLRQKNLSKEGAVLGAIVFSLSGFMMGWLEYGNMGHAALWLPLMLLLADKIIKEYKFKLSILLSIVICLSVLAGYPQLTIYSLLAVIFFSFFAIVIDVKSNFLRFKSGFSILFAIVLGIGLASIQIIPSIELLQNSLRGEDAIIATMNYGFLPPRHLITALFPDAFGNPVTGNYFGSINYNDLGLYVGIIPLLLALFAPIYKRREGVRFFFFLIIVSLIFSIENPISRTVYSFGLPGFSGAIASRALFLFDFSIACLSGYGLDLIIKKRDSKGVAKNFLALLLLFLSVITYIWFYTYQKVPLFSDLSFQSLSIFKRNLLLPTLIFILGSVLILIYLKKILPNKLEKNIPAILILLITLELLRQGLKFNPFTPKEYYYPETNVTNFLEKNLTQERVIGTIPASMTMMYRFYSPDGYDPLLTKRYSQFTSIINGHSPKTGSKFAIIEDYQSKLVDLLGVKYIIYNENEYRTNFFPGQKDFSSEKYKLVFSYGKTKIYENLGSLPRAFLASSYVKENDDLKISQLLLSPETDLHQTIILEKEIPNGFLESKGFEGTATIKDYKPNYILLSTKSNKNSILFLSDNYYPGWKVNIDGKPSEILRADFTFRAVLIPNGDHEVKFIYQPDSFKIGLYISTLSFLMVILLSIRLKNR